MSTQTRRCPYCDQVLPEFRLGVRLPNLQTRIFDLVMQGGVDGIPSDDLFALTYNGSVNGKGIRETRKRNTLQVHIHNINELIEDAGYRIVCSGGAYRLQNRNASRETYSQAARKAWRTRKIIARARAHQ